MDENADPYAVREITLLPEQIAMFWINGAYRAAEKAMTFVEDAIYSLRIREAMREGKATPEDIAWRALELEGWKPKWVTCGELTRMEIDPAESGKPSLQ